MPKMNEEVFNNILGHITNGLSLRASCKENDLDSKTFYDYMLKDDELSRQYACACEARSELKVSDMHEIADTEEDVQRARLKIDVIKWEASKLKPKKYGDVTKHQHEGKDGGKIEVMINTVVK